ncbi:MAG: hypothetical protein HW410_941 [Nitrosarchaeum sp.]|nr:hypothetical protein [Nitrosarchaeum sp.]
MIIKNKKMTSRTTKTILFAGLIFTLMVSVSGMNVAEAAQCSNPHCYATGYEGVTLSGARFTTFVTDLVPVSSCSDTPTVTHWVYFSNGDKLEDGFTSGLVAGSCYTTEKSYYATDLSVGGYTEYNAGSLTIGSINIFEISDTDKNKYWLIKRNTSQLANILMSANYGILTEAGIEGNRNNPSTTFIPTTHIYNFQKYAGSPSSWLSAQPTWDDDDTYKYYLSSCTNTHFHVRTGNSLTCSGSH